MTLIDLIQELQDQGLTEEQILKDQRVIDLKENTVVGPQLEEDLLPGFQTATATETDASAVAELKAPETQDTESTLEDGFLDLEKFRIDKKDPKELPQKIKIPDNTIILDNPLFDQKIIKTDIGNVRVDDRQNLEDTYNPGTPEESDFYIKNKEIVNQVSDIAKNPILKNNGKVNLPETQALINETIKEIPSLIVKSNEALSKQRRGEESVLDFDQEMSIEEISLNYTPTRESVDYVKDVILQQSFDKFETFEDYQNNTVETLKKIYKEDPIISSIEKSANLTIQRESDLRLFQIQQEAIKNGTLDTPEGLLAAEKKYTDWANSRFNELFYENNDVKKRRAEYALVTNKAFSELYKPFQRSKDEDYKEIDTLLKQGYTITGELKDAYKKMGVGWVKLVTQVGLALNKPESSQRKEFKSFYETNNDFLEKENILSMSPSELREKFKDREWFDSFSKKDKKIIEKAYSYSSNFINRISKQDIDKKDFSIKDILKGKDGFEGFKKYDEKASKEMFKDVLEMMRLEQLEELALKVDTTDMSLLDTTKHLIGQSSTLIPMYGGGMLQAAGAVLPGYGKFLKLPGKALSLLGTANIFAQEFSSNVFETMRKNIMQRNGGKNPTVEDYIEEIEDPDSVNMFLSVLGAGGSAALEKIGVDKLVKASGGAGSTLASLFRGEVKQFLTSLPRAFLQLKIAGEVEGLTEGFQGYVHDAVVNIGTDQGFIESLKNAKFDVEGYRVGKSIGTLLPFVGKITSQTSLELKQIGLEIADRFDMTKFAPTYVSTNRFFKDSENRINKLKDDGKITPEQAARDIRELSIIRNAGFKVPPTVKGNKKRKLTRLLIEKTKLEDIIKTTNDKDVSAPEIKKLQDISNEIINIIQEGVIRQSYLQQSGNVTELINKYGGGNIRIIKRKTTKGLETQIEKLKKQGWNIDKKSADNYGTVFQKGDKQVIILNESEIVKGGAINTAAHEFLHALLYQTVKNSKGTAIALGNNLLQYIKKVNPSALKNTDFAKRIEQYKNSKEISTEVQAEEVLTLFSEAVLDNAIELNENVLDKIGNIFTNILESLGFKDIYFNNGKDVYNFIKKYNKNIVKGKLNKAQRKLLKESAKGKLVKRKYIRSNSLDSTKLSLKEDASNKVQEIYDTKGKDGAFEITEEYKGMANKIANKYQEVPGFDKQLLVDEILTGKRGVLDMINEYDPTTNVPLAAYINKYLRSRAIEAANRILKQEFETDVTEAKSVVAEETKQPDVVSRKIKKPSETIAFDKVTEAKIDEAINKNFKGDDVKFSDTRNVPKDIANIYGEKLGLNPQTITDKTRNYSKKDAEGLTRAKQFLLKNAKDDYARLPKLKDDFGKGTFVPKNVKDALYTDGKLTGSLKDYMDLIREKPVKPIYRDRVGQTIRGLLNLAIRNRMLETAQPLKAKRIQSGAKFSMRRRGETDFNSIVRQAGGIALNSKSLDVDSSKMPKIILDYLKEKNIKVLDKNDVDISKNLETDLNKLFNSKENFKDFDKKFSEIKQKYPELNKKKVKDNITRNFFNTIKANKDVLKYRNFVREKLFPIFPKSFFTSGTFAGAGTSGPSRNFFYYAIGDLELDSNNFASEDSDITAAVTRVNYTTGSGKLRKINENWYKKDFLEMQFDKNGKAIGTNQQILNEKKLKGLKKIFLKLESLLKDKENIPFVAALLSSTSQGMGGFVRVSAPITFVGKNLINGIVEEHTMPASFVAKYLFEAAIDGNINKDFTNIEKSYQQGSLDALDDKKLKGSNNGISFNYTQKMPENWKFTDNVWDRYFNINTASQKGGIDGNNYIMSDGKTLFEKLNITSSGLPVNTTQKNSLKKASKNNSEISDLISENSTTQNQIYKLSNIDEALKKARSLDTKERGISVFDFDDTLARTKSKIIVTMPDGKVSKINATEFAKNSVTLEEQGAKFNFDEFNKVIDGKKGPLADLALKRQGKFGSKDIFVLTARPQLAAPDIYNFLKNIGLELPIENITGLESGSPQAKANWIISKAAEGYNNFYFADDAIKNVKAVKKVLDQVDVKSKVQIAKASKKRTFDKVINNILESSTGIKSEAEFSKARAQTVGAGKGKFTFLTTPSAEDFVGLIYKFLGKGKIGNAQFKFFQDNLIDPYNKAELAVTKAKITAANDFKALKSGLKTLPKSLSKQTGIGGFTFGQAARVAVWTRQGMEVPGLSKRDAKELNAFIDNNTDLNVFVNELINIQKGKPYPKPSQTWLAGNITSDIVNEINKVNRKEYMQEFNENIDIIFSDKVMNKLEAAYGPRYVEALRDIIRRMKSGSNRPVGNSRIVDGLLNWLNNSVGAIMFLNTRSAVLQTISAVNFINFGNNNLIAAGKAFANQKQYWKDFMTLFNSPYLVERRDGLKINVSESEIADAVAESSNKPKAFLNLLLNKGFVLTRIADSFAIAAGGSTFYRNQVKAYVKSGMDQAAAEKQAFDDFYAVAETSQQSSNPSKISQQQASGAGRVILAFANTPMQYNRIIKRSTQDLINGRGDWKTNVSKIVYYGAMQNLIFNALQTALFALAFGEEDEEQEDKTGRIANGMADSLLRGLGIQGAAVVAIKDALTTIYKQANKEKGTPEFRKAISDLFGFSPPLDSKVRKLTSGLNTLSWEREKMSQEGFNLNNPAYLAFAQVISGLTNVPLDRAIQKINNLRAVTSDSSDKWQKVALLMGWSTWDLGLPYYGVEDKVEMTPQMILKEKVNKMKKETSTKQQKETLLKLGLTKQQIKDLKYEEARVKKIIELQEKKDGKN